MRIIISTIFLLAIISSAHAKEWRGIVPLYSTRADVERILGTPPPERNRPDAAVYKQEHEDILVRYSTGKCIEKWNVPRDTVIYIHVFPKRRPKFSELNIDISKYRKYPEPELPEYSNYDNEEEGFEVSVDRDGLVEVFIYYWTAKDNHLRCPEPAKPNKGMNRTRNKQASYH
jgi:hypothetical protein